MQEKEPTIQQIVENARQGRVSRRQLVQAVTAMGISSVGAGVIVAAASNPSPLRSQPAVNPAEDSATHLQLHDQHLTHQGQGNTSALYNDYADHAVVEDSMYAVPIVGRAAIIARKSLGFAAASNVQITVLNRIAVGNQVTVEWVAAGIHTGDLPGLPATNRPFTLRGVTVVVRERGKIIRESLYYDVADLYRQLGQEG